MSYNELLKNPNYNPKGLQTQWMNSIFQTHELICGCNETILHLLAIINSQGKAPKPLKDIRNIQCLLTGDTSTETTEEDPVIEDGILEKLFSEDLVEDGEPAASG